MTRLRRPILTLLAAALPSIVVPATGCHADSADVDPSSRSAAQERESLEGRRVEFAIEPGAASKEELEAAARHVETLADVAAAKVKMRVADNDATVVSVELWGAEFPADEKLTEALRGEFPFLKDAIITVAPMEEGDKPPVVEAAAEEEDPEVLRQRIIEDMRAKGVEGDIIVDIKDDGEGGREVEVRVEKHSDEDEGPDALTNDPA